jgi:hypothetical protein
MAWERSLIAGIVITLAALWIVRVGSVRVLEHLATAAAGAGLSAAIHSWFWTFDVAVLPKLNNVYPGWGMLLVIVSSPVAFISSYAIARASDD